MGFGLLFIGYFFLLFYPVGSMGIVPNAAAVGCIIMFFACGKLAKNAPDCKGFSLARFALIPYFAVALAEFALDIAERSYSESNLQVGIFEGTLALLSDTLFGVFSVLLAVGIFKLAKDVGLDKLASRAGIVMSITVVYSALAAVSDVARFVGGIDGTAVVILNYIGFAAFILEYAAILANLWQIFSCYAGICLEGDEDMPYREDIFDKIVAFAKRSKK